MTKPERKKLFVDRTVQSALLRRMVLYFVCCLLFLTIPLFIAKAITEPDRLFIEQFGALWSEYGPLFVITLLLLPFVLYDVLRISHRFVGPLYRLRREMERLANGEKVEPIKFRDHDFWKNLADLFNRVADRLEVAEDQSQAKGRDTAG